MDPHDPLLHIDPRERNGEMICVVYDTHGMPTHVPMRNLEAALVSYDRASYLARCPSSIFGLDFQTILALIREYERRVPTMKDINPDRVREVFGRDPIPPRPIEHHFPLGGA